MTLASRIFFSTALLVGLGFWWIVRGVRQDLSPRYRETLEDVLVDLAASLAAAVEVRPDGTLDTSTLDRILGRVAATPLSAEIYQLVKSSVDIRVYVTDARGALVYHSKGDVPPGADFSRWNDVARTLRGRYGARTTRDDPADQMSSVLYIGAAIPNPDGTGTPAGVLTVGKPARASNIYRDRAERRLYESAVVLAALLILFSFLLSMWLTRPLAQLVGFARAIRDGGTPEPPRLEPTELKLLGSTIDEMRRALEGKEYVEHYVQTLTHELKSPLTGIRAATEILEGDPDPDDRKRFLGTIALETARLEQVVARLLELAALERRPELAAPEREVIDLGSVIEEAVAAVSVEAEKRGVGVRVDSSNPSPIGGDRMLVFHAIRNLLQNAVDFTARGGSVSIRIEGSSVIIDDEGAGIPDFAVTRVFERFYSLPRPDSGKKSSGLGLCFVQEVVRLHGGSVRLENRIEGRGARAVVKFG